MTQRVTKRDGSLEPVDLAKISKVLTWAAEGLDDVSVSQVEMSSHLQLIDGMSTKDIHAVLVKSAANLISVDTPDYQYMAARLNLYSLRKEAYGGYNPPHLADHIIKMIEAGKYDRTILVDYNPQELEELAQYIDHDRDWLYAYAATKQLEGKYLVKDRHTGQIHESPQMMNMLISMCLFQRYVSIDRARRMDYVKRFYDALSNFKLSLPTPIMSGLRTPTRQFSSCVVITTGDSLDSINETSASIVKYVSQRAGIGLSVASIRALGSAIRGGEAKHTGLIPFIKKFQSDVKCCSQGGVRGGAATVFFPWWHYESPELMVLKNNRGTEDNRARHLDYGIEVNGFMYRRLQARKDISLFSPSDVPNLLEAFYADQGEFERLYEIYESDPSIPRRTLSAVDFCTSIASERASTGRLYVAHMDHMNTNSPFDPNVAPVRQSNLCLEIALPTKPVGMEDETGEKGEIALCTLGAFNLGAITEEELPELSDLLVRGLDTILDYQDYPRKEAKYATMLRRPLGIGVINYAYDLARRGLRYTDPKALEYTHRLFEAIQYNLLSASVDLAVEFGACPAFHETTYAQGVLPIDRYKKSVDKLTAPVYYYDWESLRERILKHGLRNSTLTALMPSETSSQISNATNGIEPPRGLVSVKQSKDGVMRQVVPDIKRLRRAYETLWEQPSCVPYLQLVGVMQKFVDQAISANTNYDPVRFPEGKVSAATVLRDMMTAYSYGVKTLYYHNTRDGADDTMAEVMLAESDDCAGGGCKI